MSALPWLTVLTTPARPQYLQATIESINANGGDAFRGLKWIFVDGDARAHASIRGGLGWNVVPTAVTALGTSPAIGSARSMANILRSAALSGAPYVLYFEDDLALCRNAVTAIDRLPVPDDCWALQFCDLKQIDPTPAKQRTREARRSSWPQPFARAAPRAPIVFRQRTDHHWGNQALKIPADTLALVAGARFAVDNWPQRTGSDVLLGQLATSPARPHLGVVAPSLVQHVGAVSLCNPGRYMHEYGRAAHNFPGVDFDALTLVGGE